MKPAGSGSARTPTVAVVNNDVPTDPAALKAKQREQADAAVASAEAKVKRQKQHLASASKDKKPRQRAHLAGAQEALAQATAQRKELG